MKSSGRTRLLFLIGALLVVLASGAMLAGCHESENDTATIPGTGDDGDDDGGAAVAAGLLSFTAAAHSVAEETASANVTVARSSGAEGKVTVRYITVDGTAFAGEDYVWATGVLTWENGDSADKIVAIPILNSRPEGQPRNFVLELSSPTGGAVLGAQPSIDVAIEQHIPLDACLAAADRQNSFIAVYEGMARQPELADEIMETAESLTGASTGDALCCEAQAARARAVGELMVDITRQPEMLDELRTGFLRLAGAAPAEPCCLAKGARMDAVQGFLEVFFVDPAMDVPTMIALFEELNGPIVSDNTCTDMSARWMAAVGSIFENSPRGVLQPGDLQTIFLQVAGAGPSRTAKLGCGAQTARMESYGKLFWAIGQDPLLSNSMRAMALEMLGPSSGDLCTPAVAAGYQALATLYEGIARQPEAMPDLLGAAAEMGSLPPL